MKKHVTILILIFLIFTNCKNQNEPIQVGEVIELTPEEQANIKKYAPKFSFDSFDGKTIALDDLKGKYLYIDVWATWCGPCLQQLPAMKELGKRYENTNVQMVSISIDRETAKDKWKQMIEDESMTGLQLFAGTKTSFARDYSVNTIPRFLIIGKEGEILNNDAPRPMDYQTGGLNQELLKTLDTYITQ